MNIRQFKYILAVAELKNFEAAAERCFITQSTLSTMISRFESEIGINIFNRKTKPVSITLEGEQIIERLRIVINEVEILEDVIQELKGEIIGELRLGIIPTITPYILPLFANDFANQFPKVKLVIKEMTTSEIHKAIKHRSIDVGILALPLNDRELLEYDLYHEPFLVYDCTELNSHSKVSVYDLDYSKIYLLEEGHCLSTQVKRICEMSNKVARLEQNIEFKSGSINSLLKITETRKGITIIPYLASLDIEGTKQNKLVAFKTPVPGRKVGLILHKFFVKKKLLKGLQGIIKKSVFKLIPQSNNHQSIDPL